MSSKYFPAHFTPQIFPFPLITCAALSSQNSSILQRQNPRISSFAWLTKWLLLILVSNDEGNNAESDKNNEKTKKETKDKKKN